MHIIRLLVSTWSESVQRTISKYTIIVPKPLVLHQAVCLEIQHLVQDQLIHHQKQYAKISWYLALIYTNLTVIHLIYSLDVLSPVCSMLNVSSNLTASVIQICLVMQNN